MGRSNPPSWISLLERYSIEEREFGDCPPPAAAAELGAMLHAAKSDGLVVDEAYLDFLRIRNGCSFDGLMLYGARIPADDPFRRGDLVVMNQYDWNRGEATVIGTSDLDAYVIVGPGGPYRILERTSWDVLEEFATCDELLYAVFARWLEHNADLTRSQAQ